MNLTEQRVHTHAHARTQMREKGIGESARAWIPTRTLPNDMHTLKHSHAGQIYRMRVQSRDPVQYQLKYVEHSTDHLKCDSWMNVAIVISHLFHIASAVRVNRADDCWDFQKRKINKQFKPEFHGKKNIAPIYFVSHPNVQPSIFDWPDFRMEFSVDWHHAHSL